MNVLFSVVLLKINLLTMLLTITQKHKHKRNCCRPSQPASVFRTATGRRREHCDLREVVSTISHNGYELVQEWLRVRRQAS